MATVRGAGVASAAMVRAQIEPPSSNLQTKRPVRERCTMAVA